MLHSLYPKPFNQLERKNKQNSMNCTWQLTSHTYCCRVCLAIFLELTSLNPKPIVYAMLCYNTML